MGGKIVLVFVAALVIFQLLSWNADATVVRRDAPAPAANNSLDDVLNSLSQGIKNLVTEIQNNELYQNTSKVLEEFGQKIQQQGQDLVNKLKNESATKT